MAAVWIVLIGTLAVNAAANIIPINGITTAEVSDQFNSLFTPADYVFSIWSLIYIGLLAFAAYQSSAAARRSRQMDQLGTLFVYGNIANTIWLLLWHYQYIEATIALMLVLLGTLIASHVIAYNMRSTPKQLWMVRAPISLYLGWISVATIANAAVVLLELGWNGAPLSPEIWTVVMCVVAAVLAGVMVVRHKDWIYTAVIAWAIIGIIARHWPLL